MPFIQRTIQPVFLSRPTHQSIPSAIIESNSKTTSNDEFNTIANCTLSNVLRQLASVVLIADEILTDLGDELQCIRNRTDIIKKRINGVEKSLDKIDLTAVAFTSTPKQFTDDVSIYKTKRAISTSLFTESTRPVHIKNLYEKAAATPVLLVNMHNNVDDCFLMCSPVLGYTRQKITKKIDAEIETRVPAAIEDLRKWTSAEAIGEITVTPNCLSKVGSSSIKNNSTLNDNSYASFLTSYVDGIDGSTTANDIVDAPNDVALDHKLPSPEEQSFTIAQRYPAEMISVDTSNVRFERMCSIRKSLGHVPMGKVRYSANEDLQALRRPTRKKASGKRRNTIAGIDDKDIKEAYTQRHSVQLGKTAEPQISQAIMPRSKSNDLLRSNGTSDTLRSSNRFNHFKALKQWGKHRLRLINKNIDSRIDEDIEEEANSNNTNQVETKPVKSRQKTPAEKSLKQNPLYSSSEKLFTNLMQKERKCSPPSSSGSNPVKLRASMTRRQRRNQQHRSEEPNSSSGNWSASSESGRTSASSEIAMHTKSSASCTSLNHNKHPNSTSVLTQRKFNTSTSSSITSDDTLTHEILTNQLIECYDDETSSMYSCDTEGYFTSFHVDSGLKTLKEEEITPVPALISTSAILPMPSENSLSRTTLSVESDYELFGKGSTSTTASSAGTVCTTRLGSSWNNGSMVDISASPERRSSPNLSSMFCTINNYGKPKALSSLSIYNDAETKKSRLNESNVPITSKLLQSHTIPNATISDMEFSENSDIEGAERVKRIRGKTLINSKRIPSMCVITPLTSDDEDRVVALETMLSNLNVNTMELQINELPNEKTIAQIHGAHKTVVKSQNIMPGAPPVTKTSNDEINVPTHIDDIDGDYVTIADVNIYPHKSTDLTTNNLEQILLENLNLKTEYVSLNELPCNSQNSSVFSEKIELKNQNLAIGCSSVKQNSNGLFIYDSNSLRYKKGLCTTFKGIQLTGTNASPARRPVPAVPPRHSSEPQIVSKDKRLKPKGSPLFEKMAFASDLADLDDVYVTLAAKSKIERIDSSDNDQELDDAERELKSSTWPITTSTSKILVKPVEKQRRFSWEHLTGSKTSQLKKLKNRCKKFSISDKLSKQKPPTFKTSTPLRNPNDTLSEARNSCNYTSFGNSTSITPVHSDKNTMRTTSCSDRLGVPKTSLNDFKKLLLTTGGKRAPIVKPSAVEQLKLKRPDFSLDTQPMKILDLSGSPRSFANRRILQHGNVQPYKKSNTMSPRSRWKHNTFSKNSISSIPEANIEDDIIPIMPNSIEANKTKAVVTTQSTVLSKIDNNAQSTVEAIAMPESQIIAKNISLSDNIFLQAEENNFMKGEVRPSIFIATKPTQNHKSITKPSTTAVDHAKSTAPQNSQNDHATTASLETSF